MIEKWLNKCPHLFIQQNFIACLFCAKYHSGTGGYVSKQYILDVLLSQTPEDQTTQSVHFSAHYIPGTFYTLSP